MKNAVLKISVVMIGLFLYTSLYSQTILSLTKVEQDKESVVINYNLVSSDSINTYSVEAWYSLQGNNKIFPIKKAIGFIGNGISRGLNKTIVWDYVEEIKPLSDIDIKIILKSVINPSFRTLHSLPEKKEEVINMITVPMYFPEGTTHFRKNYFLNSSQEFDKTIKQVIQNLYLSWVFGYNNSEIVIEGWAKITDDSFSSVSESRTNSCFMYLESELSKIDKQISDSITIKSFFTDIEIINSDNGPDWNGFMTHLHESDIKDKVLIENVIASADYSKKEVEVLNMVLIYPELLDMMKYLERVDISFKFLDLSGLQLTIDTRNDNEIVNALKLAENNFLNFSSEDFFRLAAFSSDIYSKLSIYQQLDTMKYYNWKYYNEYGIALINRGLYKEALTKLLFADSISMNNAILKNNLAIANYYNGKTEVANMFIESKNLAKNDSLSRIIKNNLSLINNSTIIPSVNVASEEYFTLKKYQPDNLENKEYFKNSRKYAIIIGISDYKYLDSQPDNPRTNINYDLKYAANDAERFCDLLRNPDYFGEDWDITMLLNKDAHLDSVRSSIKHILRNSNEDDIIYIFYSGHGTKVLSSRGDSYSTFLLTYDSPRNADDDWQALSYDYWLKKEVKDSRSNHIAMFVDACYSGSINLKGDQEPDYLKNQILKEQTNKIIFTSGTHLEASQESDSLRSGIFTYYLLKGLSGGAIESTNNRYVDSYELYEYVSDSTKAYQKKYNNNLIHVPALKITDATTKQVPISKRSNIIKNDE